MVVRSGKMSLESHTERERANVEDCSFQGTLETTEIVSVVS